MLKIGKGLKKKKKSKKHKKGEEELFKPEELEQYRREHQQQAAQEGESEAAADGESSGKPKGLDNDEWKKFNALAAGVDHLLKKTQTDLDRIKSTSFFQRKPPPKPAPPKSEANKSNAGEQEAKPELTADQAKAESLLAVPQIEDFESESEYEDDEDDIFDTSFVDGVESGEIKLAYVPESPEQENAEDEYDPFDTTEADKIIKGPEVSKKGKKLVSIGPAVEVLTGRVDLSTCAIPRKSPRRGIVNLLLEQNTVDTNGNPTEVAPATFAPKSLLDDDDPNISVGAPIDLSVSLVIPPPQPLSVTATPAPEENKLNLSEFDAFAQQADELDDEFASLAAESLKTVKPVIESIQLASQPQATVLEGGWDAFGTDTQDDLELEFPRQEKRKHSSVSIHITDPSGQRESVSSEDLNALKPSHRDLLGGSTTDLSKLANQPIEPIEVHAGEDFDAFSDPFDTSLVDQINLPGKTELKFIEAELLGDTEPVKTTLTTSLSDPDFDPRDGEVIAPIEPIAPTLAQTVGFQETFEDDEEIVDPFDTSFVGTVAPGKEELKLIESELAELETQIPSVNEKLNKILSDSRKLSEKITPPKSLSLSEPPEDAPDFLFVSEDVDIKALTPAVEDKFVAEFDLSYVDPFDTSVASNILPGKAELKLLETELLESVEVPKTETSFDKITSVLPTAFAPPRPPKPAPISDLLTEPVEDDLTFKALTPEKDTPIKEDFDDIDPFDTSITNTLVPGKVELKLLESELIH